MDKLDLEEKQKIATLNREKRDAQDGMGWMYKGVKPDAEEYLLGKRLDKFIEGEEKKEDEASVIFGERIKANIALDMAAKMREDPLFAIRRKEEESRKKLLENPVKMKELQKLIEQQKLKKKKKKSTKQNKKHKKSKHFDDSSDDIMTKYLSILTSKHHKDKSSHKLKGNCHDQKSSSGDDGGEEDLNQHKQNSRSYNTDRPSHTSQKRKTWEDRRSEKRHPYNRDTAVSHRHQHKDFLTDRNNSPPGNYSLVNDGLREDVDRRCNRTDSRNTISGSHDDRAKKRKSIHMGIQENKKSKNKIDNGAYDDSRTMSVGKESTRSSDKNWHKNIDANKGKREFTEEKSGRTENVKSRHSAFQEVRGRFSNESHSSDTESSATAYLNYSEKNRIAKTRLKTKHRHRSSSSSSTSGVRSETRMKTKQKHRSSSSSSTSRERSQTRMKTKQKHRSSSSSSTSRERSEGNKVVLGSQQYGLIVSSSNQTVTKTRHPSSPVQTLYKTITVRTALSRRAPSPPRRKLTEEEKQRKLAEMSQNALWREGQRESNVKRYKEKEQQREKNDVLQKKGSFLSSMMMSHASSSSVEDRLRRNKYNIQRTQFDLDKNFTQK